MDKKIQIAQTILTELDQFENFTVKEYKVPAQRDFVDKKRKDGLHNALTDVYKNEVISSREPFIAYIRVKEKVENDDWQERIYLVCRNYSPLKINPVEPSAIFLNRNAPAGIVASKDVGDEGEFFIIKNYRKVKKKFEVLEKNVFIPNKTLKWDAIRNNLSYDIDEDEDYIPSLRSLLPISNTSNLLNKNEQIAKDEAVNLLREIEETELKLRQNKELKGHKKQRRIKAIVDSIALKDQPILDKYQDKFCRLPLSSQILLVGSPGTGKTTTLIKRLVFKSDNEHLSLTDNVELESYQLRNWRMFTPNELLKIYLKEAMVKEGLQATDNNVITWEKERTSLGRDILKLLKTPKSGIFLRSASETLSETSSASLIKHSLDFIRFFNDTIQNNFSEATLFLEKHKIKSTVISKENSIIAQKFNNFSTNCVRIRQSNEKRKGADAEINTIRLIDDFQRIKPELTELRSSVRELIKRILDNVIIQHPELIQQVSNIIAESKAQNNSDENAELIEIVEETEIDVIDEIDEEDLNDEESNIKVEAMKQIRQTLVRYSESIALNISLKNKRQLLIWSMMESFFLDKDLLNFIGMINISLRRNIFGQLDYARILEQIPVVYDKFRQELFKAENRNVYLSDSIENIKNKKISLNETDIIIYAILRLAGKIFQEKKVFLRDETNFNLLENIKAQYRTQIAVDEAADFSAVQLGCMFHLAHPDYKSVSFAGDLMQRVTHSGLNDWKECEFISEDLKEEELVVSYRQTPVLLQIASRLYENILGKIPPFHSKNKISDQDPKPLKIQAEDDESLGNWITQRIHEIYEINNSQLPSIAVFVPEESDIDVVFEVIQEKLNDISIDVEKCKEGKVLGTGAKVRIFSVEFIKGLEFEGVFFIGIDDIHDRKPDLLDKYLYVGLTRATTFLGVTYKTQFPSKIQFIENDFSDGNWSEFTE